MNVVMTVCFALVIVSVFIVLTRVEKGPSMLDRAVAMDVVTAALIQGVAILTVARSSRELVPIIAALALVGFIATVTIARFAAAESSEDKRILTREELAQILEQEEQFDDDAAPVHDVDALDGGEAVDFDVIRDGVGEEAEQ
ncbi:MAG: monovalent cation/H+ antiporter complex subunit F [Ruaniaceae bacterium]|nr:monovalent cation/H+ antiporter complex subunit F [Ruaniaceae bacterium]